MGADLSQRLVPDELWQLVAPLLPPFAARPQGGGSAPCDERAVFTAVVYVLTCGCAWRHLPPDVRHLSRNGASPVHSVGCEGSKWRVARFALAAGVVGLMVAALDGYGRGWVNKPLLGLDQDVAISQPLEHRPLRSGLRHRPAGVARAAELRTALGGPSPA
ncbi:transposase [Streptomyces sp. NPDC091215]|uniref:transposase n=1 Tax=Streptomyces sp. NPDC091215 TaxID=3155192 RepID=UPI0034142395